MEKEEAILKIKGTKLIDVLDKGVEAVTIPDFITTIGQSAFQDCFVLETVIIPDSVTSIEESAFYNCPSLKNIRLPNSIKKLSENMFDGCSALEHITIPDSVTSIEEGAFYDCSSLQYINIPNSIKKIGQMAFEQCTSLKNITIPDSVKIIEQSAFRECLSLESITIPSSITIIKEDTFASCTSLKSVHIPNSVTYIGKYAFAFCDQLKNINIPDSVTCIESSAFVKCSALENITIPNSVTNIRQAAFAQCYNLRNITLPNSITTIKKETFRDCYSLENLIIPDTVTSIEEGAFQNCSALKNIIITPSVTSIGSSAFMGCFALENISIPESVTDIGYNAFSLCPSLKHITMHINPKKHYNIFGLLNKNIVLKKTKNGFCLEIDKTKKKTLSDDKIKNKYLLNYYIRNFDDKTKCSQLDKLDETFAFYIYTQDLKNSSRNIKIDYERIFQYDFKWFGNLNQDIKKLKNLSKDGQMALLQLCEVLGVFNKQPIKVEGISKSGKKKIQFIDYAQKATEFLKERIKDTPYFLDILKHMMHNFINTGFKREFADFFLDKNNFKKLLHEERLHPNFISKCYNLFDKIQFAHTSNRGHQRQLAPSFEFFKEYLKAHKFYGITEENKEIAQTISEYFSLQRDFDMAVKIDKEKKDALVADDIIPGVKIKEESVFEKVDDLLKDIKNISIDTTKTLVELSTKRYTYEFLSKSDPNNFILGKLCSCCAHINGAGNGIMKASIIHPDVQNIVIRNSTGKIVAKSTIYVNREQGYAVCNNVEVHYDYSKKSYDTEDKELIYQKFKQAVTVFAEKYNATYPDKPLRIITVGMNDNQIEEEIIEHEKKSEECFVALDYSRYAFYDSNYAGDSSEEQYVIWEDKSLSEEEENG